jgi:hypothetical protein
LIVRSQAREAREARERQEREARERQERGHTVCIGLGVQSIKNLYTMSGENPLN